LAGAKVSGNRYFFARRRALIVMPTRAIKDEAT
jgi:hypothetical protein